MYIKDKETLKGQIVLIDPYVNKKAKLSKDKFLERVENVKYLRTTVNSNYISFYITSIEENNNLIKFHDLVNNGSFDFNSYYVFAVAVQPKLYNWFKTTDIITIQKQIVCWMAGFYYFNVDKRETLERQVYKPLFEEILDMVENYYNEYSIPDFGLLSEKHYKENDETIFTKEKDCCNKYLDVCEDHYKSKPPDFLSSPFDYKSIDGWGTNEHYNFEFIEAYLSDNDWKRIVEVGNSMDNMHRVESMEGLFIKWKHVFTTFDRSKNFVYSFYFQFDTKKRNSAKYKRETTPQHVKDKVWRRDNGECNLCGSNEKLEFDHIIPVSKGGASTYRNIQLLCESCNRKKSDNI